MAFHCGTMNVRRCLAGTLVMLSACASAAQPAEAPTPSVDTGAPAASTPSSSSSSSADAAAPAPPIPERTALVGIISSATIFDLVMKNQELFNDCYTIGAGKSHQFVATVTVRASVGPTGVVNDASVIKSTAKNAKVDECVLDAFRKMSFPATGSTVPITFPMKFDGVEEVK